MRHNILSSPSLIILALSLIILALLLGSTTAAGQKVYKCKSPDGNSIYQQVQCPDVDGEAVKIYAGPSEATIAAAQERLHAESIAQQREQWQAAGQSTDPVYRVQQATPNQRSHIPSADPRALNPSRYDPNIGFDSSSGYTSIRKRSRNDNTTATRVGPGYTEPSRVQDQHGNNYNRPPGSDFVIDEKTGRQCLAVGGTIRCD